jgi:two-component system, OmpR family, phosphate regulon sensor histidine kinase PhoR
MKRFRLFWLVFPSFVAITLGLLLLVFIEGEARLLEFHQRSVAASLETEGRMFAETASDLLSAEKLGQPASPALDALAKRLGKASEEGEEGGVRVTVILRSGKVIAESDQDPSQMEDHRHRQEIAAAIDDGQVHWSVRASPTMLGKEYMYVAVPVVRGGETIAVVRTAKALAAMQQPLDVLKERILWGAGLTLLLVIAASWVLARRISRPLEIMTAGADRFGRGDLAYRLPAVGSKETAALAEAMNGMAAQLDDQIQTIVRQRNEQDAVLQSMAEGVLTLDRDGRILDVNDAGARMFQIEPAKVRGRFVFEVLRRPALLAFVDKALSTSLPLQEELAIQDGESRFLAASGSLLRNDRNEAIGVIVVLRDVTQLRRLENVRRDFVANASHELRTPVTAIKGFVETLLEGGMDDKDNARRFLDIIHRNADRLTALIDDILSLARIEKESEEKRIAKEPAPLSTAIDAAVERCQPLAATKRMRIESVCPPDLIAPIHANLLEQAVSNLIDNAIKYSKDDKTIRVTARRAADEVTIAVADEGYGIEARHVPRLFERFYVVDRGRSREVGGTGLGLAIVKHITLAHGGWVSVESKVGIGSTFTIHLPPE